MLSRISSRWESEDGEEGAVQGNAWEHSLARADLWASATIDKTQHLAEQQRAELERERKRKRAQPGVQSAPPADRAGRARSLASTLGERTNFPSRPSSPPRSRGKDTADPAPTGGLGTTKAVQSAPRSRSLEPPLSAEQREVYDMVVQEGRSLMFTGGAGTGKSVLARAIVRGLCSKYGAERVAVTATTGIAALHIGGRTLHSWTGVGMGNGTAQDLAKSIVRGGRERRERWKQAKVLVIDEVSMLDAVFFDKLESIARAIRGSSEPFGGIQLVLVGDFYQLPPVVQAMTNWKTDKADQRQAKRMHEEQVAAYPSRLLFHAFKWSSCVPVVVVLKTVFRQSDSKFVSMLEELRRDQMSPETIRTFQALARPLPTDDGILPTELYPTRIEVSSSNEARLRALRTHTEVYVARDRSRVHQNATTGSQDIHDWLNKMTMFPHTLELREKAQVMLLKNCNEDLVNGSRGIIVGFLRFSKATKARRWAGRFFYPRQGIVSSSTAWSISSSSVQSRHALQLDRKPAANPAMAKHVPTAKKEEEADEFDDPEMDAAFEQVALTLSQQRQQHSVPIKTDPIARAGSMPPVASRGEEKAGDAVLPRGGAGLSGRTFQRVQSDGPRALAQSEQLGRPSKRGDESMLPIRPPAPRPGSRFASGRAAALQAAPRSLAPAFAARGLDSLPGVLDSLSREEMSEYIEIALPGTGTGSPLGGLELVRDERLYPIVRFVNGREYLVVDTEHRVQDHLGREEGTRVQLPLMLAWSMSIHKAQGMTLDKVSIDLSRAFERGQAYVALSRATDLNMLQVRGFSPSRVRTDPLVVEWEKDVLVAQEEYLAQRRLSKARETERDRRTAEKRQADSLTLTVKDHPTVAPRAVDAMLTKHRSIPGKKRRI